MTQMSFETRIDAPKDRVWKIISNLGAVADFHPYATNSFYNSNELTGIGASRVCEFPQFALEETVLDWQEGKSFRLGIDFLRGTTPPIRNVRATMSIRPNADGTVVQMDISYETRFGPIGALMDRMMIRRQYSQLMPNFLQGLKHHAETGELVKNLDSLQLALSPA